LPSFPGLEAGARDSSEEDNRSQETLNEMSSAIRGFNIKRKANINALGSMRMLLVSNKAM
jgi:hypothetical protein